MSESRVRKQVVRARLKTAAKIALILSPLPLLVGWLPADAFWGTWEILLLIPFWIGFGVVALSDTSSIRDAASYGFFAGMLACCTVLAGGFPPFAFLVIVGPVAAIGGVGGVAAHVVFGRPRVDRESVPRYRRRRAPYVHRRGRSDDADS